MAKFGVLFEDTNGPAVHHKHGTYTVTQGKLDRGDVVPMRRRSWWTITYEKVQVRHLTTHICMQQHHGLFSTC